MDALVYYTSIPPYVLNTIQLFRNIKFVLQKRLGYLRNPRSLKEGTET